jgi:DNA-binding response OmpR family regulator
MALRALIVEDERDISDLIQMHLRKVGFDAKAVSSAEEALALSQTEDFQLFLIDWMLPGMSGLDLLKTIRSAQGKSEFAVVLVTAKDQPEDVVLGLEAGADDYLSKPFDPAVLRARVLAVTRRLRLSESVLQMGALKIDLERHEVSCEEELILLTTSEFKLLTVLALQRGRVLTRKMLNEEIQGIGVAVVDRAIDTHIFGLRKKLKGCADFVETVRGVGYRIRT